MLNLASHFQPPPLQHHHSSHLTHPPNLFQSSSTLEPPNPNGLTALPKLSSLISPRLSATRPTSPLPARISPLKPSLGPPSSSFSTLCPSPIRQHPASFADVLPLTPSRKRNRSVLPTQAYTSLGSSVYPTAKPNSFSSPSHFASPLASYPPSLMTVRQTDSHSPLDSRALDYFGKAKAVVSNHSNSIWGGLGLWPESKANEEYHAEPLSNEGERDSKRRKGVAGTILDTALDAALFTTAVGYAAYQLWRGKSLEEAHDSRLRLAAPTSPPPPYEQCTALPGPPLPRPRLTSSKRLSSQRKTTRIHVPRARARAATRSNLSARSRAPSPSSNQSSLSQHGSEFGYPLAEHLSFVDSMTQSLQHGLNLDATSPLPEDEDLMGDFVSSLDRLVQPTSPPPEEVLEDEELDEDEEVVAFKAKIQTLILSGQAALASRPDPASLVATETEAVGTASSHRCDPSRRARDKTSTEVQILSRALAQTARGPARNWWESPTTV